MNKLAEELEVGDVIKITPEIFNLLMTDDKYEKVTGRVINKKAKIKAEIKTEEGYKGFILTCKRREFRLVVESKTPIEIKEGTEDWFDLFVLLEIIFFL